MPTCGECKKDEKKWNGRSTTSRSVRKSACKNTTNDSIQNRKLHPRARVSSMSRAELSDNISLIYASCGFSVFAFPAVNHYIVLTNVCCCPQKGVEMSGWKWREVVIHHQRTTERKWIRFPVIADIRRDEVVPVVPITVVSITLRFDDAKSEGKEAAFMEEAMNPSSTVNSIKRPVAASVLRTLNEFKATENNKSQWTSKCTTCTICQEAFALDEHLVSLPCHHVFHYSCVCKWFESRHTCPLCRFALPTELYQ